MHIQTNIFWYIYSAIYLKINKLTLKYLLILIFFLLKQTRQTNNKYIQFD